MTEFGPDAASVVSGGARERARVFIAHSSMDKDFVDELAGNLQRNNIEVWYDKWAMRVGDSLFQKIQEGITGSDFMIVVLSPRSLASRWVQEELNAGLARNLASQSAFVLPLMLEGEVEALPPFLREKAFADFRHDLSDGFRELLQAIIGTEFSEVRFVSRRHSSAWREVLAELPERDQTSFAMFLARGLDGDGTGFYSVFLSAISAYEAELEVDFSGVWIHELELQGLVTKALSTMCWEPKPVSGELKRVYKAAARLTRTGYLIARELGFEGIDSVRFETLPER